MTTQEVIIPILALSAVYFTLGVYFSAVEILPKSKDDRTTTWRIIIWPVVLLVVLAHKIGPFCTWFIKELREAPKAIARALQFGTEK